MQKPLSRGTPSFPSPEDMTIPRCQQLTSTLEEFEGLLERVRPFNKDEARSLKERAQNAVSCRTRSARLNFSGIPPWERHTWHCRLSI